MRRPALLVLLLAAAASAQETTKLPFNPFEAAKEGDWEVLTVDTKLEGRKAPPRSAFKLLDLVTYRVRGADADEVKVGFETVPVVVPDEERVATVYSRSETPAFDRLLDVKGTPRDVKVGSEKRTIAGRELACTRIAYTLVTSRGARTENVALFSKDVKAFGLVELVNVIPLGEDSKCTITYRLAGFGTKDKVELGKKPEELAPRK